MNACNAMACCIGESISALMAICTVSTSRQLVNKRVTIYGQQEVVKDLVECRISDGAPLLFEVDDVTVHDLKRKNRKSASSMTVGPRKSTAISSRVRRLPWRLPAKHSGPRAQRIRARLSVWLARHPIGESAARSRIDLFLH